MNKKLRIVSYLLAAGLLTAVSAPSFRGAFADTQTATLAQTTETTVQQIVSQTSQGTLKVRRPDLTEVLGERAFYLPEFSAVDENGADISSSVVITSNKSAEMDQARGTIKLLEDGEHTITYSVPSTNLSRSFKVTRRRVLFDYFNLSGTINEYADDNAQSCISLNSGQGVARFNVQECYEYYAEVKFNKYGVRVLTADGKVAFAKNYKVGLAHIQDVSVDKGINTNLWLGMQVDLTDGMKLKTHKIKDYSLEQIREPKATSLVFDEDYEGFTMAVGRVGTTLYTFINGELVDSFERPLLEGVATAPGILTSAEKGEKADFVASGGISITNMSFISGSAASAKIQSLLA